MRGIEDKKKRSLHLIKSTNTENKPENLMGSDEYYKQVEYYAQQIRQTKDTDEIIQILDIVLSETRGLRLSDEAHTTQEKVKHAEQKIELLKHELEQLRELVQADQMTGAFNRRGLDESFRREAARADRSVQSLGLALIDLDNFKQINDFYGHQYGDRVLRHLVMIAKEMLRPSDIVARYGGEEFVILLPDVEMQEAVSIIHRIQNNLAEDGLLHINSHQSTPVTFSAGVAIRLFGEPQKSVIKRADKALYEAKHAGKNRVFPALSLIE